MKQYLPHALALVAILAVAMLIFQGVAKWNKAKRIQEDLDKSEASTAAADKNFDPAPYSAALNAELNENYICALGPYENALGLSDAQLRKVWADYEAKYKGAKGSLAAAIASTNYFAWNILPRIRSCEDVANQLKTRLKGLGLN